MKELLFKYQPKDFLNYNKDSFSIERIAKPLSKIIMIQSAIAALILAPYFTLDVFNRAHLIGWFFCVVLIAIFIIVYILLYYFEFILAVFKSRAFGKNKLQGFKANIKLTINDDTIIFDNDKAQSIYKWNLIKDIYNKKYNLLIFVADMQAIIIPKRIFNSCDDLNDCWNYIKQCHESAQNQ